MSRGRLAGLSVALGLIASEAGHLAAYQVRYGPVAQQIQSSGAHAYFPLVVKTAFGLCALFALLALLAVALARLLAGRRLATAPAPPLLRLVAILFCLQLTVFVSQECLESAAGAPVPSAPALLLWGTLGQLPVAVLAALVLRWLAVRVAPAVASLLAPPTTVIRLAPEAVRTVTRTAPVAVLVEDARFGRTFPRRGPPL